MCNNAKMFAKFKSFKKAEDLGDGHVLEATGEGIVQVKMKLPDGNVRRCNLRRVLFVPNLAYNLLSVSKAAEAGKTTQFDERGCQILTDDGKVTAVAKRVGNLYYLECEEKQNLSALVKSKERLWRRVATSDVSTTTPQSISVFAKPVLAVSTKEVSSLPAALVVKNNLAWFIVIFAER